MSKHGIAHAEITMSIGCLAHCPKSRAWRFLVIGMVFLVGCSGMGYQVGAGYGYGPGGYWGPRPLFYGPAPYFYGGPHWGRWGFHGYPRPFYQPPYWGYRPFHGYRHFHRR